MKQSPLTDSNRRPPPYHAIKTATGGSQWQRFRASSGQFPVFGELNLCHRLRPLCSITVPSQSAQNGEFERRPAAGSGGRPFRIGGGQSTSASLGSCRGNAVSPTDHHHEPVRVRG